MPVTSATINNAHLSYELAGNGPAFVMVHGHLLDMHQWDNQFEHFSQNYQVLRYDARGYGDSTLPPEPFMHAADLHALLAELAIERMILMGCSGGGQACIDFALQYPHMIERVILVGTAITGFQPSGEISPILLAMWEAEERGATEEIIEHSLRVFTDGERRTPEQVNPAVRERTRAMTAKLYARTQVPEAEERGFEPNAVARLEELGMPTLVVVGSEDTSLIQEIANLLVARIPHAEKFVIADAAHHPNMEHPAEFNGIVRAFLERTTSSE